MNGPLETSDMLVVTVRVPTCDPDELAVSVEGDVICVQGPKGYWHEVPLPAGADADRLHADLFRDVLELRAPRESSAPSAVARSVPVCHLI
jgi:HSP20 family molecular chaperone IbpA